MSKDFIDRRVGSGSIREAQKQQRQLSYFTESKIQQDITVEYLDAWANRKFRGSDDFLNWVKTVFKTENFLAFFKYLRFPVASARLINERIKTPLSRVFHSEDSFFDYIVKGVKVEAPDNLMIHEFNDIIFNALLFRHNDIIVHDLRDINDPFRTLVSIDNVVALDSTNGVINRIAYTAIIVVEERTVTGTLFIDDQNYMFFEKGQEKALITIPHDLGECPADYVSKESFGSDDIVRKSIFTYSREQLEEYVFLKTLQRMTEPNGGIPITTQVKTKTKKDGADQKGSSPSEPMSQGEISGQNAELMSEIHQSDSLLQTGTVIKVPAIKKTDGSMDMDFVKNFINFFHMPVENMKFINERVSQIEQSIIVGLCGDFTEANESAKNELQVSRSFVSKQDKLRELSLQLTRVRNRSDFKMLALQFGKDNISVECFYGSDFFLESQQDLYDLFEKSPNTIEARNILIRLTKNRTRFNKSKSEREVLLYQLLPFVSDKDFKTAIDRGTLDETTFKYQNRFNHWIGIFEANFGDILEFFNMLEGTEAEKLVTINNLIITTIPQSTQTET